MKIEKITYRSFEYRARTAQIWHNQPITYRYNQKLGAISYKLNFKKSKAISLIG